MEKLRESGHSSGSTVADDGIYPVAESLDQSFLGKSASLPE